MAEDFYKFRRTDPIKIFQRNFMPCLFLSTQFFQPIRMLKNQLCLYLRCKILNRIGPWSHDTEPNLR